VQPTVSLPHLPSNTAPAASLAGIAIDQVVIGSCTNGRLEDLRQAAELLRGRKVHPNVRLIILPGTQQVCLDAAADGTMAALIEAGGAFSTPTCGPCLGGHMGVLAEGERAVATTNRNFVGRMGHPKSEVYLASPYVAAASALAGHIATPEMVDAAGAASGASGKGRPGSNGGAGHDLRGAVHKFGRDVDTDVIIPARYLNTNDPAELGSHCMEDIDAGSSPACEPATSSWPPRTSAAAARASTHPWPSGPPACRASWRPRSPASSIATRSTPLAHRHLPGGGRRGAGRRSAACRSRYRCRHRPHPGHDLAGRPFPAFMQELIAQGGLLPYVKARLDAEATA